MNVKKKINHCVKIIFFGIIIYLIFFLGFARVEGSSMKPTLYNGDIIIYKKNKKNIERFDIVIFKLNNQFFIKRVIGLPGEKVEYSNNKLYVDNEVIDEYFQKSITNDFSIESITNNNFIPEDKILVLGDNRLYSHDSREFGLIDISKVEGIFLFKI